MDVNGANGANGGNTLLGIDIGSQRIGVALARLDVRIPQPLTTIVTDNVGDAMRQLIELVAKHDVIAVVAGWPRGLAGQATEQTRTVEAFVERLKVAVSVPVHLQDEALTSHKAEAELTARRKPYSKADIDALAATYILDDYLQDMHA